MKTSINRGSILELAIKISLVVLPLSSFLFVLALEKLPYLQGIVEFKSPYSILWIGFYSVFLNSLLGNESMILNLLKTINLIILAIFLFISFLNGFGGLIYSLIRIILPFLPVRYINSMLLSLRGIFN